MTEFICQIKSDLAKIDITPDSPSFSKFSPPRKVHQSIKIHCPQQVNTPRGKISGPLETTLNKIESKHFSSSLPRNSKGKSDQKSETKTIFKKEEFESWKRAELQKFQEARKVSDFINGKLAEDKRSLKTSLDPLNSHRSSSTVLSFYKEKDSTGSAKTEVFEEKYCNDFGTISANDQSKVMRKPGNKLQFEMINGREASGIPNLNTSIFFFA